MLVNPVLTAESLRVHRGDTLLIEDATFSVGAGERLALMGPNGSGKSTLLAILAGRRPPTEGRIRKTPGHRVVLLGQGGDLPVASSVAEAVAISLAPIRALEAEMRAEERRLADGTGSLVAYSDVVDRFERAGGYRAETSLSESLDRLGLAPAVLARSIAELSGGERRRLALALVLASGADVLLLDEPTTHLDLPGRTYLAKRLRSWPGTLLVATHDRALIFDSCTGVLELTRQRVTRQRPAPAPRSPGTSTRKRGEQAGSEQRTVMFAHHLTKRGDRDLVLDDVAFRVQEGEVVALVGANGSGKSTLLALLAGELASDDPRIERHYAAGVRLFWADQHSRGLPVGDPPLKQLERWVSAPRARQLLGLARLPVDAWHRPPTTLSGGERARAGLALMVATEANLLLLDEPEAHLDLDGILTLEHMLADTRATVVFASHDRRLIEHVATRVMVLADGQLTELRDGLTAYLSGRHAPPDPRDSRSERTGLDRPAHKKQHPDEHPHELDTARRDALENERIRLEEALLDPSTLPERERLRTERRLRVVLEELSEHYDAQFPQPPPRVGVRESGVRFGALPHGDVAEIVGPPGARAHVRRVGRVAHLTVASDPASELLPWARSALVRAAVRLTFYLWDVDTLQIYSRHPLHGAGLASAGSDWWIRERRSFEAEEGWIRSGSPVGPTP